MEFQNIDFKFEREGGGGYLNIILGREGSQKKSTTNMGFWLNPSPPS